MRRIIRERRKQSESAKRRRNAKNVDGIKDRRA